MSNAEFSVTGSVSGASPHSDAGFDAVEGETLTLQLEASPGLDVQRTQFEVAQKAPSTAADLTLSNSGVPPTPLGPVTAPVAASLAAYLVRSTINGGRNANGALEPEWTKERIIVVRRNGVRPVVPGERTQYHATEGWFEAINGLLEEISSGIVSDVGAIRTTAYTAELDELVRCDPSTPFTVSLPTAAGNAGRVVSVKNVTASTNTITIDPDGSETIDGAAAASISSSYGVASFMSDGTNWMAL